MFDAATARVLRDERLRDLSLGSYVEHGGLLDAPLGRVWALVNYLLRADDRRSARKAVLFAITRRQALQRAALSVMLGKIRRRGSASAKRPVSEQLTSGWSPLGP